MTQPLREPGDELEALMRDQSQRYEQALAISDRCLAAYAQSQDAEPDMAALHTQMAQIKMADEHVRRTQQAWQQTGAPSRSSLRNERDRLAELIKKLIGRVDLIESQTRDTRDRLAPQLSREARGREMVMAYRAVSESE